MVGHYQTSTQPCIRLFWEWACLRWATAALIVAPPLAVFGLLVVRGRYAKKRLTAPYLESSVSATPLLRGKHLIGGSFLLGDGVLGIISCLQEKSVASSRRFPQRMCGYSCAAATTTTTTTTTTTAAHAQDKVACQSLARGHLERWGKRWLQLSS